MAHYSAELNDIVTTEEGEVLMETRLSGTVGGLARLSDHSAFCDEHWFMTEWAGHTEKDKRGDSQFEVEYSCSQYKGIDTDSMVCNEMFTDYILTSTEESSLSSMSRMSVSCPEGTALKGWEGQKKGGNIRIHYTCCGGHTLPTGLEEKKMMAEVKLFAENEKRRKVRTVEVVPIATVAAKPPVPIAADMLDEPSAPLSNNIAVKAADPVHIEVSGVAASGIRAPLPVDGKSATVVAGHNAPHSMNEVLPKVSKSMGSTIVIPVNSDVPIGSPAVSIEAYGNAGSEGTIAPSAMSTAPNTVIATGGATVVCVHANCGATYQPSAATTPKPTVKLGQVSDASGKVVPCVDEVAPGEPTNEPQASPAEIPAESNSSSPAPPVVYNSSAPIESNSSSPAPPAVYNASAPIESNSSSPAPSAVYNASAPIESNSSAPVVYNATTPRISNESVPVKINDSTPVESNASIPVESSPSVPVSSSTSAPVISNSSGPESFEPLGSPQPTLAPVVIPTTLPTVEPTTAPYPDPTLSPTALPPTPLPTLSPTFTPSEAPSFAPNAEPSDQPTALPTNTNVPISAPTFRPVLLPTRYVANLTPANFNFCFHL